MKIENWWKLMKINSPWGRFRAYEGERKNCFSKIQLVGQKNIETKYLSQVKARNQSYFTAKHYKYGEHFSLLVGYNI